MSASAWRCRRGSALLIPSGPDEKKHLFAILLDPVKIDGYGSKPQVLLASVLSVKPGIVVDNSCLLDVGDHPFIEHPSFVDYRFTRIDAAEHIKSRAGDGVFVPREDCSEDLIRRIIAGALKSKRISREYKQILEKVVFG